MIGNIWIDLQMSLVRPCRRAVRKPVAASKEFGESNPATVSAWVERSTTSGASGPTRQTRNRFRLRRITVG
jgi:hypothetical protein